MDELRELYQQVILDHNKYPKNYGKVEHPTHSSEGYNPLCGDRVNISLDVEDGVIRDIRFEGSGCAISKASASLMTSILKGKKLADVMKAFEEFQEMVTSDVHDEVDAEKLGKLAVFAGVREFPSRVKCASLAWHTLVAALRNEHEQISTE